MKCNKIKKYFASYVTGEIKDEEIKNHIDSCEICKIDIKELQNIWDNIKIEVPEIPKSLEIKIFEKIKSESLFWVDIWEKIAIGALFIIALFVGFKSGEYFINGNSQNSENVFLVENFENINHINSFFLTTERMDENE